MAYRVTTTQLDLDPLDRKRSSAFEVPTDVEALRIAQEGVAIAREQGRSVTYEIHDAGGQLIVSYSSGSMPT